MDSTFTQMLCATLISSISVQLSSSLSGIVEHFCSWCKTVFSWCKDFIYGPLNSVTITFEYNAYYRNYNTNNKLLISAITYGYDDNTHFVKFDNRTPEWSDNSKTFNNNYEKEKHRILRAEKTNYFTEDGIDVNLKTEEHQKHDENRRDEPYVSKKDILTLSSRKSMAEIQAFIEKKKNVFLEKELHGHDTLNTYQALKYNQNIVSFTQVPNCSKKTFDDCFFPQKSHVLQMIDDFKAGTGPYSRVSTQKKMVFLLHGVPGCGKTSFIKALSNRLERNIFQISLERFTSLESFRAFFYSTYVSLGGNIAGLHVPFKKRIVVFEEIDTAGNIVMNRDTLRKMKQDRSCLSKFAELPYFTKIADKTMVERLKNKKKKENTDNDDVDNAFIESGLSTDGPISLGDVLMLLDGITEIEEFVCVMTTNHKDILDPALVRPGRVTCDLEFSLMRTAEIKQLLHYHFTTPFDLTKEQVKHNDAKITDIATLIDNKYTPSKLEYFCLNCCNLQALSNMLSDGLQLSTQ